MIYGQILITGGAGFIGSHLTRHLMGRGARCTIVDDLSTGSTGNLDLSSLALDFRLGDVCDAEIIAGIHRGCDLVIHLAASVGVQNVISDPLRALSTNIEGVRVVAEHCAVAGIPLVYVSSSAVYQCGHAAGATKYSEEEDLHPCGAHRASIYPETKLLGETICRSLGSVRNLRFVIVRPFNFVGAGQTSRYGMVVPTFVRQALSGQRLTVFGDGLQTRTFSDVDQGVELLCRLIDKVDFDGGVVNLAASEQEISIIDLAHLVVKVVGSDVPIEFVPYDEAYGVGYRDVATRRPRLERLRRIIGDWEAVPLEQTLNSILQYEMSSQEVGKLAIHSSR